MITDISALVANCLNNSQELEVSNENLFLEIFEATNDTDGIENDKLILNEDETFDLEKSLLSLIEALIKNTDNRMLEDDNVTTNGVSSDMKEIINFQGNVDKEILINNIVEKLEELLGKDFNPLLNKVEVKEKLEQLIDNLESNEKDNNINLINRGDKNSEGLFNLNTSELECFTTENFFYKSNSMEDENNKEIHILNNIIEQPNKPYMPMKQAQPIVVREQFITQDIVKTINYLKSNDMQELKVNLSPKDLGDMTIKFTKGEKDAKVLITLSKEDMFEIVNKNIKDIQNHLSSLDIKVKEISVEVRADNQNTFSDDFNQHFNEDNSKHRDNRKFKENEINTETQDEIYIEDIINLFA